MKNALQLFVTQELNMFWYNDTHEFDTMYTALKHASEDNLSKNQKFVS